MASMESLVAFGSGAPNHNMRDLEQETDSMLLNLPPELRNRIYELVLPSHRQVEIFGGHEPALLAICRQIRAEAKNMYYNNTIFYLKARGFGQLKHWTQMHLCDANGTVGVRMLQTAAARKNVRRARSDKKSMEDMIRAMKLNFEIEIGFYRPVFTKSREWKMMHISVGRGPGHWRE